MSPLVHALAMHLVVWTTPAGTPVLVRHVRELGGLSYVAEVVEHAEQAALVHGHTPELLAALLFLESGLNPEAVNEDTGAWGLGQLHPGGAFSRGARRECSVNPGLCMWSQVWWASAALRQGYEACDGSDVQAVSFYRSGRCTGHRRSAHVLALGDRLHAEVRALAEQCDATAGEREGGHCGSEALRAPRVGPTAHSGWLSLSERSAP